MTTRIIVSALAAGLVPALFWLGGLDFDHRGEGLFFCALMSVYVFFMAYMFPRESK